MATDDYTILEEFAAWRSNKALTPHPDPLSIQAFRAEREAEHNAARIDRALAVAERTLTTMTDPKEFNGADARNFLLVIDEIRKALTDKEDNE